jgi:hypothetical protein
MRTYSGSSHPFWSSRTAVPTNLGWFVFFAAFLCLPATARAQDNAYITMREAKEGSWFVNQYARGDFVVEIQNVAPSECVQRQVVFEYLTSASPGAQVPIRPAFGEWVSIGNPSAKQFTCVAMTKWKMGDSPGRQVLSARLLRAQPPTPGAAAVMPIAWKLNAHALPGVILGLAYLGGPVTGVTETDPEKLRRKTSRLQPIVGVDFPIISRLLPTTTTPFQVFDHLRFMVATSFGDPGYDLYTGVEIFPLTGPRAGAMPVQITIGHKFGIRADDNFFTAIHFNASSAIASVFSGFGIK